MLPNHKKLRLKFLSYPLLVEAIKKTDYESKESQDELMWGNTNSYLVVYMLVITGKQYKLKTT